MGISVWGLGVTRGVIKGGVIQEGLTRGVTLLNIIYGILGLTAKFTTHQRALPYLSYAPKEVHPIKYCAIFYR